MADLRAGNADDRNDQEVPSSMAAANAAAAAVGKQTAGGVGEKSNEEAAGAVSDAMMSVCEATTIAFL